MTDGTRDPGLGIRPDSERTATSKSRIPALALATAFGVGYVPVASGTFGSAVGLLVWALLPATPLAQGVARGGLFVAGPGAGNVAERHFGRTDPGEVVIDEVMGMLLTLFLSGVGWKGAIVGFFLFRLFDVVKPPPARRLERLHGGVGVMADDAMAAVYANLALRACLWSSSLVGLSR
jgi:phosphatidylglycerophosphatase A